jgi:ArsR family transcriptional regulator
VSRRFNTHKIITKLGMVNLIITVGRSLTEDTFTVSRKGIEDMMVGEAPETHLVEGELPPQLDVELELRGAIFKALGDKNRQKLLYLLRDGEKCVSDMLPYFDILQPTVSTHLLLMEETGILKVRRDGRRRIYSVADPRMYEVLDFFVEEISSIISR